ncbi:hypothetical protein AB6Q56_14045 [Dechloromonas sp. ARDL1]|uniref:hypothetical protein n=1 Tax=Dechloromonas sp. ARDL1 TaxID=3322121 RepID=UPI003DA77948
MIRFVLSVISVNLYNDQTRCFVDRMGKYFSSLLDELLRAHKFSSGDDLIDNWAKEGFFNWQRPFEEVIRVSSEIFDQDGRLKPYTASEWKSEWVEYEEDEIPF